MSFSGSLNVPEDASATMVPPRMQTIAFHPHGSLNPIVHILLEVGKKNFNTAPNHFHRLREEKGKVDQMALLLLNITWNFGKDSRYNVESKPVRRWIRYGQTRSDGQHDTFIESRGTCGLQII